jgi:hypothetical protein
MASSKFDPVVVQSGEGKVYSFPTPGEAQKFEADAAAAGAETLRLVPELPPVARPLYDLETHLAALLDTEDVVPEDLEREYALELHATLLATVDKRDAVGHFLADLEAKIALAHGEVVRLQKREKFFQAAYDKLEGYVMRVIESLGLDSKGKRKKLEGNVITLSLHGCDKRAEVTDEAAVPTKYKRITLTLPYETWETLLDSLDLDFRDQVLAELKAPTVGVSTSLVKADLKANVAVPGAQLAGGTYLERK